MKKKYTNIESKINSGFRRRKSSAKTSRRAKSKVLIPLTTNENFSRNSSKTPPKTFSSTLNLQQSDQKKVKRKGKSEKKLKNNEENQPEIIELLPQVEDPLESMSPKKLAETLKSKISFLKKRKKYIGKKQRIEDELEVEDLKKRLEEALENEAELKRLEEQKKLLSIEKGLESIFSFEKKLDFKDKKKFLVKCDFFNKRIQNLELVAIENSKLSLKQRGLWNLQRATENYKLRFLFLRNFSKILRNIVKEKKRETYISVFRIMKKKRKNKPFHLVSRKSQREKAKRERKSKNCDNKRSNKDLKEKSVGFVQKRRELTPEFVASERKKKVKRRVFVEGEKKNLHMEKKGIIKFF